MELNIEVYKNFVKYINDGRSQFTILDINKTGIDDIIVISTSIGPYYFNNDNKKFYSSFPTYPTSSSSFIKDSLLESYLSIQVESYFENQESKLSNIKQLF